MLYKPKFCCNCGEKIERTNWTLFASRRFCVVCETQYKGHDLLPRAIVGLGILAGLFGVSAYFQKGNNIKISQLKSTAAVKEVDKYALKEGSSIPARLPESGGKNVPTRNQNSGQFAANGSAPALPEIERRKITSAEPVYFCGARTKKGTPCSRRLKAKGRCWQHTGKPAAAETEASKAGF